MNARCPQRPPSVCRLMMLMICAATAVQWVPALHAKVAVVQQMPKVLNRRGDSVARLGAWANAVTSHVPGRLDPVALTVSAWTSEQLRDLGIELDSLLVLMENPEARAFTAEDSRFRTSDVLYSIRELDRLRALAAAFGGRNLAERGRSASEEARARAARVRLLKRAAILHTDVARLSPTQLGDLPSPLDTNDHAFIHFYDGQLLGADRSADHWQFARSLLDRVRPAQTGDAEVLQWYQATLAWMLENGQLHWPHFQRAEQLYPDDPELLYLRGCLHETFGSSRVQNLASRLRATGQRTVIRSARSELELAESYLRRAVAARPLLVDARLRLGRVQSLTGKETAALAALRDVLVRTTDPVLLYYANLFLGSAFDSLNRLDEARAAYMRAADTYPGAAAPRLALSHLALRAGDAPAAVALLEGALHPASTEQDDPWWTYGVKVGRGSEMALTDAYRALSPPLTP